MEGANDSDRPGVSIVVPSWRAGGSIRSLAGSIDKALTAKGHNWELILVDDASQAAIESEVAELEKSLPIRIDVCRDTRGDVSHSVLRGLAIANHKRLVVMEAASSHLPEHIERLLTDLDADHDMVIGSRCVTEASADRASGPRCWSSSLVSTVLTRPLVNCTDPKSGFFAVDKCALPNLASLRPAGSAIGLELIVRGRLRVAEAPIPCRASDLGLDNMSFREQWDFLRHLSRLYRFKFGSASRMVSFALVGVSGFVVDLAGYVGLQSLGAGHVVARLLSFWPAVTWNWWLNRGFTFHERPKRPVLRQWIEFIASSLLGFAANVGTYVALTSNVEFFAQDRITALICGVGVGAAANFLIASKFVYPEGPRLSSDTKTRT